MIPTVAVWAEPIKSGDFDLAPNDVSTAIAWYREKTRQEPKLIFLNPMNKHLAREAGDSITVMYRGGVLAWEVWLSVEDIPATLPEPNESDFEGSYAIEGLPVPITKKSTLNEMPVTVDNFRPRGRQKQYKKRELPEELISQLHGEEGMGSKAIASHLKASQGITVSYKTIQRILSGARSN